MGDEDCCGDAGVEALAGAAQVGDEDAAGDEGLDVGADAAALIAYHQEGIRGLEGHRIEAFAVEEGAIHLAAFAASLFKEGLQRAILHRGAEDAAHGGLHHLGVEAGDGVGRADDTPQAKPVGSADDGAQVAGILQAVEHQREGMLPGFAKGAEVAAKEHPHLIGALLRGEAFQLGIGHLVGLYAVQQRLMALQPRGGGAEGANGESSLKGFETHLGSFHHEETLFLARFGHSVGGQFLQFCFRNHDAKVRNFSKIAAKKQHFRTLARSIALKNTTV